MPYLTTGLVPARPACYRPRPTPGTTLAALSTKQAPVQRVRDTGTACAVQNGSGSVPESRARPSWPYSAPCSLPT
eukprot:3633740-Rhodomonas_salina.3